MANQEDRGNSWWASLVLGAGRAGVQSWHLIEISKMLALGWPTASSDAQVMFFNTTPAQNPKSEPTCSSLPGKTRANQQPGPSTTCGKTHCTQEQTQSRQR